MSCRQLIDGFGYLKVIDFGSAKKLPDCDRTYTLCGCSEYLSPEALLYMGYNKSVDFWSVGILLYELIHKSTPFYHANAVSACILHLSR